MLGLPIGFTAPWLLVALIALPVLWLILRAIPPAPVRRRFPGVVLLLGLSDEDTETDRTPWWLLALRMLVVAAVIVGLSGPVLNPDPPGEGRDRLLILTDGGWASAAKWPDHIEAIESELAKAARQERSVALVSLTDDAAPRFLAADLWKSRLAGLVPAPWLASADDFAQLAATLPETDFDTFWLSGALDLPGRAELLATLQDKGAVRVFQPGGGVLAMEPVTLQDGRLVATLRRSQQFGTREMGLNAIGLDPAGNERVLAALPLVFVERADQVSAELSLPAEMRARITRFEIAGVASAGAVALGDDALRRREVALIAGRKDREGLELLSPLHYLRKAFVPTADVLEGALEDVLPANPDVIVLADVATLSEAEKEAIGTWVEAGGLLLRFAGPRIAAGGVSRSEEDPLMPVRLRAGGRSVGGAMSWGEPKSLAPFDAESPFFGLPIPDEVRVTAQVMAQPDPTLANRVIAALTDGTPLVTRKKIGAGQVVLFHVTANAEWSGLPLSGLFVQMLDRLAVLGATDRDDTEQMAQSIWQPLKVLDGFGRLKDGQTLAGVSGEILSRGITGPELLPGLYQSGEHSLAVNSFGLDDNLARAVWPVDVPVQGATALRTQELTGLFLAAALGLLALDVLASLLVSGRLWGARVAASLVLLALLPLDGQAQTQAQGQDRDLSDVSMEVVLGHVLSGDRQVDEVARQGLYGLSRVLAFRTSIEPAPPRGVDLELDELALFPFLYWPVSAGQPLPSDEAYGRLNDYLRSGGMILFDTRDADVAGFGAASPNGRKLQQLARRLDVPPLDPLPEDHVLTRTFYLLQDFPGRFTGREIWVEAAPPDAVRIEGMPFRNLNDGVTPVVFGGNDWAAAWAMSENGRYLLPVGRGRAGERQRELAYRFGVNLIMHVLTGNYKSDQVHVPALLERLGQ